MTKNQEVLSRFCFHIPTEEGKEKMSDIRKKVRELALLITGHCPESREKATALTNLQTVMMNANSAIVQAFPPAQSDFSEAEVKEHGLDNAFFKL